MALDQIASAAALLKARLNFAPDYIPHGGNSFWGKLKHLWFTRLIYSLNTLKISYSLKDL
jgi:hypothetical protein